MPQQQPKAQSHLGAIPVHRVLKKRNRCASSSMLRPTAAGGDYINMSGEMIHAVGVANQCKESVMHAQ